MSILTDTYIKRHLHTSGSIGIDPIPYDSAIQPCSVDLRLSNLIQRPNKAYVYLGPKCHATAVPLDLFEPKVEDQIELLPGDFILGSTMEWITIPNGIVARIEGKSSIARMGLLIHCTAGFIDSGFEGNVTLEIKNLSPFLWVLNPGMYISQIAFYTSLGRSERVYGSTGLNSHYQKSAGAVSPVSVGLDK